MPTNKPWRNHQIDSRTRGGQSMRADSASNLQVDQ